MEGYPARDESEDALAFSTQQRMFFTLNMSGVTTKSRYLTSNQFYPMYKMHDHELPVKIRAENEL